MNTVQTQRTEIKKERKETKEFYSNSSNHDSDSISNLDDEWGTNKLSNLTANNLLDEFVSNKNTKTNKSSKLPSQQDWFTNKISNIHNKMTSDLFEDKTNNLVSPSLLSKTDPHGYRNINITNTKTNTNTNTNTKGQSNTLDTVNTLEERLNSQEMKTCRLEDIWEIEERRYWRLIPVGGEFGPEDVTVKVNNGVMTVVVQKEVISKFDGKSLGFEGFAKSFSVPDDADVEGMHSTFTADGQLRIEVPRIA